MRKNKGWNGLLPAVCVLTFVVLSGCAKNTLEVTESGFSCSGEVNAGVWECTGSAKMKQDDIEQTFVVNDNEPVHEIAPMAKAPVVTEPSEGDRAQLQHVATAAPAAESSPQPSCRPLFSAKYFYLQFSAAKEEGGLKALAAQLMPLKTNIISITTKGESWFVLVSTGFNSRQAAQSVVSLWQVQGMSAPWVRSGSSLLAVLDSQYSVEDSASGCQ